MDATDVCESSDRSTEATPDGNEVTAQRLQELKAALNRLGAEYQALQTALDAESERCAELRRILERSQDPAAGD